jgi:oligosaccharide repeat unit polymerase
MSVLWWLLVFILTAMPLAIIDKFEFVITLSFYLHAIIIGFMCRSCLRDQVGPAFATVTIFILMFFFVAPIFQLADFDGYFINNYKPSTNEIVVGNGIVSIFSFSFSYIYMRIKRKQFNPILTVETDRIANVFPVMAAISIGVAVWAFYSIELYTIDVAQDPSEVGINIGIIIKHKFIFMIPFAAMGFYLSRTRFSRNIFIVVILLMLVLLTKNIAFDRRNALGPVYLTILFLYFWKNQISSRNVFMVVTTGLLFVFPVLSIFINNPIETWVDVFTAEKVIDEIQGHFVDMHYDAWANLIASLQYVQVEGIRFGEQLLGALFFFVPRDIWPDKPIASGQLLGEHLVLYYNLWFTNISFPLPAEGYVDFGIFGVIGFGGLLAYYSKRLDYFVNHGNFVDRTSALYFTFYLLFVLRGSFLPAFAYGVGAYAAINCLPAVLAKLGLAPQRTANAEPRVSRS